MSTIKSLHERICDAVKDKLEADSFFTGGRIYSMETVDYNKVDLPCVICSFGVTERVTGGTNERDDIEYPVIVGSYGIGEQNSASRVGLDLTRFRERMRELFSLKRLEGITSTLFCEYNGRPPIMADDPQYGKLETAVLINVHCRVSRAVS